MVKSGQQWWILIGFTKSGFVMIVNGMINQWMINWMILDYKHNDHNNIANSSAQPIYNAWLIMLNDAWLRMLKDGE